MVYSHNIEREVIAEGECNGFEFYVLNLGTHPTAYVNVPKEHKDYWNRKLEFDLDVHGGITYMSESLCIDEDIRIGGFWVRLGLCPL